MIASQEPGRLTLRIGPSASDLFDGVLAVQSFLEPDEQTAEPLLTLVFRELVSNAVDHGNKGRADLAAEVVLERLGPGRFQLVVEDRGEGFDHQALDLSMPRDTGDRRGLPLVNSLADELRFNEAGNQATAVLAMPQKTLFHIETQDGWKVVRPNRDITGEAAEDFRAVLLDLVGEGLDKYRFDLSKVTEIDSISLSLFVVFNNMLEKRGVRARLEITGAGHDIVRLFHMTRLSRVYAIPEQGA